MKQLLPNLRLVLAAAVLATAASLSLVLSTPATISIDGQRVASDVAPVTAPDGTYLPLRVVAEAAGARTSVDPETGAIVVQRGTDVLVLHVGSDRAKLDGHQIRLVHAPFTVRGRTMVAGNTISRTFGSTVSYDAKHNRVAVRTPGVVVAGAADDEP